MISKLTKIRNFGIFQDFSWNSSITPFQQRNLIYGWNYSGKTTLSKIFCNLENASKIHFLDAEYSVEIIRNNEIFNQENLSDFPHLVKVFNTTYIDKIFSWDNGNNNGFNPILFYLGDEAGELQPTIDKLKYDNERISSIIRNRYEHHIQTFHDYAKDNGKFSKYATEIRQYLNDAVKQGAFNKSHIINIVDQIKNNLPVQLLADDIIRVKQQAIASNDLELLKLNYHLTESLYKLTSEVKAILEDSAPKSIPFPELDEDKEVFEWVQSGIKLHINANHCKFCSNEIEAKRITSLNTYYSEKLQEIQNDIRDALALIDSEENIFNFDFPHESKIAKHLREKYIVAIKLFEFRKSRYLLRLLKLRKDLKGKEQSYFNKISASNIDVISLEGNLRRVIAIISEHNTFVNDFEENKRNALKKILHHYVADYLIQEKYLEKEKLSINAQIIISKLRDQSISNQENILRLEANLKNTVKGQEQLNIFLKILLNRNDIKIINLNDKFSLQRGISSATNLSEGEKTAIAFSYFLTELKSLKEEDKLKNTIVYFDDPISSLDSNHIFQVRSLIQHFFEKKDDYLQLFISTHNFEFLSVLLDTSLFSNQSNSQDKAKPFYMIARDNNNHSHLRNLPKTLRSHKSEYAHLFFILKEYHDSILKEEFEYKILLPNALRRFLELYTLFKYPKGYCEVDERLKIIFSPNDGAYHNTKLYHWFSHQQQFEKIAHHDGKLDLIDEAISEVIGHVKRDTLHWAGLTGETS